MPMPLLFLDFETFYSNEYSLKHMTSVEYVLDPRFEAIGCAVKHGLGGQSQWVEGPDLPKFFREQPRDVWMVSHNILFDGCVAAWRYNWFPKFYGDTLGMARAALSPWLKSFSLDRVGKFLRLGGKIEDILHTARGRSFHSIRNDATYYLAYVAYALNDNDLCALIFRELLTRLPVEELAVIDMLVRCVVRPAFVLDYHVLDEHMNAVLQRKNDLMARVATDRAALMSNPKFAQVLLSLGIPPPMKISTATGKETYAFAKTDAGFRALLEHDDPDVQALAAARLGIKSTQEESRTRRFMAISQLQWPLVSTKPALPAGPLPIGSVPRDTSFHRMFPPGALPVPLRYGAAHTHRFGGEWDLNLQNLARGGRLRKSMKARPGHKVVRVDASQIEARLTAWLADEPILLGQFERGEDPYSEFGTELFQKLVSRETPVERTLAKSAVLGCGFYLGWSKFMNQVNSARLPDGAGGVIKIDEEMAQRLVYGYRRRFWHVPLLWRHLGDAAIPCLAGLGPDRMTVGPIVLTPGQARLPSLAGELDQGLTLTYRDLRFDGVTGEWTFAWGPEMRKKLYSGKLLENFVQALDRVLVIGAALRLQKQLHPFHLQHQGHDENVYIVPTEYADAVGERVRQEMVVRPPWGPDLPLAAEVRVADSYG